MKPYFAPETSFIPPDYDEPEHAECPDSCEGCRFERHIWGVGRCTKFITADDLQAAADELAIERFEENNKEAGMNELISKIQEWVDEDKTHRSATVPLNYLIVIPEVPKIWIFDTGPCQGKNISYLADLDCIDFKAMRREKLLRELAELDEKGGGK